MQSMSQEEIAKLTARIQEAGTEVTFILVFSYRPRALLVSIHQSNISVIFLS